MSDVFDLRAYYDQSYPPDIYPVPGPADPPPGPFDPGGHTIAEVKAYIEALGADDDPDVIAETQRVLDAERAGQDRVTLVTWLDERLGAV